MERIDKIIASQGKMSRKDIKKLIKDKMVTVNGSIVLRPEEKYEPENAEIVVCGKKLSYQKHIYIMMNKPKGYLSATDDKKAKTVLDLLPAEMYRNNLFPAGRLDKDTEGLLIITNDGEFAHNMLSPKKHVEKVYEAILNGNIKEDDVRKFNEGIVFADGTRCKPAVLESIGDCKARVKITEGKFHQVKKMFLCIGLEVEYLKRVQIGGLVLDSNLHKGEAKILQNSEKALILL